MKKLFFLFLLLPMITFAQDSGEFTIDEQTVQYDQIEESNGVTYYYANGKLVASDHSSVAFLYSNDSATLEAHDTNGDGVFDAFLKLNNEANVIEVSGEGADKFTEQEPVEFAELVANQGGESVQSGEEDLVGDLSSITIPKHNNWFLYGFLILIVVGGVWWYRKMKGVNNLE